jgi:hypothetical protein
MMNAYRFSNSGGYKRSTTKDTKVHEGNLWIYLIEIFVLFVSFVVNIESSWNLRGLATGQWLQKIHHDPMARFSL